MARDRAAFVSQVGVAQRLNGRRGDSPVEKPIRLRV
jgi:hypothetical protein